MLLVLGLVPLLERPVRVLDLLVLGRDLYNRIRTEPWVGQYESPRKVAAVRP